MEIPEQEWLISTPMHCDLYDALGWKEPIFAHVGLLVNKDRQKLSKRNSDIHISSYQEQNILPEALVDFVAHLGWRAPSKKGALTLSDLVDHVRVVAPDNQLVIEKKLHAKY